MNNNQPGYGHVKRGDITSWARGRTDAKRPLCNEPVAKPTKVKGKLRPMTKVTPVDYPHTPIVKPIDTNPKSRDVSQQISLTHAIAAKVNAILNGEDPIEALGRHDTTLHDATVEHMITC